MKTCQNCGCENADEDSYCVACNSKLEDQDQSQDQLSDDELLQKNIQEQSKIYDENLKNSRICPVCGFENNYGDTCIQCNSPLNENQNKEDNQQEYQKDVYNDNSENNQNDLDFHPNNNNDPFGQNNYENGNQDNPEVNDPFIQQNNQQNNQYDQQQNNQYNQQQYSDQSNEKNQKSNIVGFLLNIIPGFGYFYLREYAYGIIFFVAEIILFSLSSVYVGSIVNYFISVLVILCYLYPMVDVNTKINRMKMKTLQDKNHIISYILCIIPGLGFGYIGDKRSFILFYLIFFILVEVCNFLLAGSGVLMFIGTILTLLWLVLWIPYPIYDIHRRFQGNETVVTRQLNEL